MKEITWDDFNYKNRNKTSSFEDMCRTLFLRTLKKGGYDFQYNYNQAGLEIEPVPIVEDGNEIFIGIQCKYFTSEESSSQYKQIYDSVSKAIKIYKNKLNRVYIYTNANLKPICTNEEIANSKKKTNRIKLAEINNNIMEIKWIQPDNIIGLIKEPENNDLRRMYFSNERESDWLNNSISISEKTFLNSIEFLNLKLNDIFITDFKDRVTENKVTLILGAAGTGKSMLVKKIFSDLSDEFMDLNKKKKACIPVLIKLRECANGDLENLIRHRLGDYNLNNTEQESSYIYFFDGLDEISHHNIGNIISQIQSFIKMPMTKSIVISSRTDSNNLAYMHQFIKSSEYKINLLNYEDVEKIFSVRGDQYKIDKLKELKKSDVRIINEITDVFSANLLWNIINEIDSNTSKIDIIELSVTHWINNYSKIVQLPLLEPKRKSIIDICIEVSYRMQQDLVLGINLLTVQNIVKKITGITDVRYINMIVDALIDLFFEKANTNVEILSYKHRRFHEYFLYKKIDASFLEQPEILRKLHLLSNKDFVINVFIKTTLNKAYKEKDILKALALRILEENLGYSYWHQYTDDFIGKRNNIGLREPFYSYSSALIHLVASYDTKDIESILSNEDLSIGDCINKDNCLELIELHHKIRNSDISELIFSKYNISKDKLINYRNYHSYLYITNKVKNVSIQNIYNGYLKNDSFLNPEISHMDYVESSNEYLSAYYSYCLEQDVEFITELISEMSKEQLEVFAFQLLKYNHILCLLSKVKKYSILQQKFISRYEMQNESYYINTIAVYDFLSNKMNEYAKLKDALNEANCGNFPAWHQNIELHNLLSYLLKDDVKYTLYEFKLGVSLLTHLIDNINNLDDVLELWLEDIKPYNFIWKDWLKYTYSNMLGTIISNIQFDIIQLKKFLRELMKYDSVIYMPGVYYNILRYNYKLFYQIANEQIIDKLMKLTITSNLEFEASCEYFFQFAVMYFNLNKEKSYSLLIDGINNEILRPQYKGESLMTMIMPGSLYFAYENYLYDNFELKELFKLLYDNLKILKNTTQNNSVFSYFKWANKICIDEEEEGIVNNLYNENELELYEHNNKKVGKCFDISKVEEGSLKDYYLFECKDAPYNKLEFWTEIIEMNYKFDPELKILYECFNKVYPGMYGYSPIVDYIYLPVAVLLSDTRTNEKFTKFIMDYAGEYGFYNVIRAYSIIGKTNEGRECIEFLFRYINMLTTPTLNLLFDKNDNKDKSSFTINSIYNSIKDDWNFFENKCTCILRDNPKIKIVWDDFEEKRPFHDKWATDHCDDKAYISNYCIYNGDIEIKHFSLVDVDGYRATLPVPKMNTNIIKRSDYLLSCLFNNRIETLNEYIISSGLIVD